MPNRDALNETLQRLAQALGAGDSAPPRPEQRRPARGALLRPVPVRWEPDGAEASLELPPGVQVAGNFLCTGDAYRPLVLHFEEGALHVVVSADRTEGTEAGGDAADPITGREERPGPGLRLRIEILLGPPAGEEVH